MSQPGPINRKRKRVGWGNELAVVIPRMEEQLNNFEDEDKDMHDVVLVVKEKKFYCLKNHDTDLHKGFGDQGQFRDGSLRSRTPKIQNSARGSHF
ncbi:hypothetical protein CAEBREN_20476 [Caenorhabditis brenneri]|uniref:Uncharacterized protein n=1 Tax=Caenorhabditis brenneri TaxID=135651 RepID=G0NKF0_CAEBE|nr:hypothetical protein CAEBREN_20476 [Caenorhabditis brenneri]